MGSGGDVVAAVVRAVLPARCAGCGRAGEPVCPTCAAALRRPALLAAPPGLDGWVAAFVYEGVAREIVARLKYRNERAAVPWLADAMVAALAAEASEHAMEQVSGRTGTGAAPRAEASEHATIDTVTWAPASAARRRGSGFDHGELLARAVARRVGLPVAGLLRRQPGPPQTGAGRAARSRGPALVAVGSRSGSRLPGRAVLLVDDVVTTGATLGAAARALRRAGAARVVALSAAATPPPGS
jgi:predicted amidophosphoribosyltransferase